MPRFPVPGVPACQQGTVLRGDSSPRRCRLVDEDERRWLLGLLKTVVKERLHADFDAVLRHLNGGRGAIGLEDLRGLFFTDVMDTTAPDASGRLYDEVQVRSC